jgi:hypothetical protein
MKNISISWLSGPDLNLKLVPRTEGGTWVQSPKLAGSLGPVPEPHLRFEGRGNQFPGQIRHLLLPPGPDQHLAVPAVLVFGLVASGCLWFAVDQEEQLVRGNLCLFQQVPMHQFSALQG